ncbi:Ig-like domain-containing protein, partial [Cohnella xylanilytica]|uniref:Ig-like domain-containing protein n=1 Tax=Cohnella xylanilytica TaxID=557555 RepID=UPI001BB344B4
MSRLVKWILCLLLLMPYVPWTQGRPAYATSALPWIASGYVNNLAIKPDNSLWMWGRGDAGQIGNGSKASQTLPTFVMPDVATASGGSFFTLAVKTDGTVWSWGTNTYGQLGDGNDTGVRLTPGQVIDPLDPSGYLTGVTQVATGMDYAAALKEDGTVWTWGRNALGALGYDGEQRRTPTQVTGNGLGSVKVKQVVAKGYTLALDEQGRIWAWGNNSNGMLADGTRKERSTPIPIAMPVQIPPPGNEGSNGGRGLQAGENEEPQAEGETADPTEPAKPTEPAETADPAEKPSEAAGEIRNPDSETPAPDGQRMPQGQEGETSANSSGDGADDQPQESPATGGDDQPQPSSDPDEGNEPQPSPSPGEEEPQPSPSPGVEEPVPTPLPDEEPSSEEGIASATVEEMWTGVDAISGSPHHVLALKDGYVYAWGFNFTGQIGDGSVYNDHFRPTLVIGGASGTELLDHVKAIAAGDGFSLALKEDGTVWGWGANGGYQLGDGTTATRLSPVAVRGPDGQPLTDIVAISAGNGFSLALQSDGTLWAWGSNASGVYGNGSWSQSNVPVKVKLYTQNADLSGLQLSAGTLNPAFSSAVTEYAAEVGSDVESVTVTPTLADAAARAKVGRAGGDLQQVPSGQASQPIPLSEGPNELVVQTASQDSSLTKTYKVTVTRAAGPRGPTAYDYHVTPTEGMAITDRFLAIDEEGAPLTFTIVDPPAQGTLYDKKNGTYEYTPKKGASGTDRFTYKAYNGKAYSNLATVTIDYPTDGNREPAGGDLDLLTIRDEPVTSRLYGYDSDGDALKHILLTQPIHGTLDLDANTGLATYTPSAGYTGTDSFVYQVFDGKAYSKTGLATVKVGEGPDEAPTAADIKLDAQTGTSAAGRLSFSDPDGPGEGHQYRILRTASKGMLLIYRDGSFTYDPRQGETGTDTFAYQVLNGKRMSNIATVTIEIGAQPGKGPRAYDFHETTRGDGRVQDYLIGIDPDGKELTYEVVDRPTKGTLNAKPDGGFTYTAREDATGTDSFTYKAYNGEAYSNLATVTINFRDVTNQAPISKESSTRWTIRNTPLTSRVDGVDRDRDPLKYLALTQPLHGKLELDEGSGTMTYTPDEGFSGDDLFYYQVFDGQAYSITSLVMIQVHEGPDEAPVVQDVTLKTNVDTPIVHTLTGTDPDQPAGELGMVIVTSPLGTLSTEDNTLRYTPPPGFTGTDTFYYQAEDGQRMSNIGKITVEVAPNNGKAPVAADFHITPIGNDAWEDKLIATDKDGDALTYSIVNAPVKGTLNAKPDGTFTYTPLSGATGTDKFTYKAFDGKQYSNVATVTVDFRVPPNFPPAAWSPLLYTIADTPVTSRMNAYDSNRDPLTYLLLSQPMHGTVQFDRNTGVMTYTPEAGYIGSDKFYYQVFDGQAYSGTRPVELRVAEGPDEAPVVQDVKLKTKEGTPFEYTLTATDSDSPAEALYLKVITMPYNFKYTQNGNKATFTPNEGFSGTETFYYQAHDGKRMSNVGAITIEVTPTNTNAPVAADFHTTPIGNDAWEDKLIATDKDGDALTYSIVNAPVKGTLNAKPDGTFTYTPLSGATGTDKFTYKAFDGKQYSNVATVTVDFRVPPNFPPVAWVFPLYTIADTPVTSRMNGYDSERDPLTYLILAQPTHGLVQLDRSTGVATYTPEAGYIGSDKFYYQVFDGKAYSATKSVEVKVSEGPAEAPVVKDVTLKSKDGKPVEHTLTATDPDTPAESLYIRIISMPYDLKYKLDGKKLTITPNEGFTGTETIYYQAEDGKRMSNVGAITVQAEAVNVNAPTAASFRFTAEAAKASQLTLAATDKDDNALTYSIVSPPSKGKLADLGNGKYSYTPNTGATGTDKFTYKAFDGKQYSNAATVTIDFLKDPNQAPMTGLAGILLTT